MLQELDQIRQLINLSSYHSESERTVIRSSNSQRGAAKLVRTSQSAHGEDLGPMREANDEHGRIRMRSG